MPLHGGLLLCAGPASYSISSTHHAPGQTSNGVAARGGVTAGLNALPSSTNGVNQNGDSQASQLQENLDGGEILQGRSCRGGRRGRRSPGGQQQHQQQYQQVCDNGSHTSRLEGGRGQSHYSHQRRGYQPQEKGGRVVEILAAERKPSSNSRGGRKGGGRGRGREASLACD